MTQPEPSRGKPSSKPRIIGRDGLAAFEENIRKAIAYRAYEIYESRGRSGGHDMEDWFNAENELLKPAAVVVADDGAGVSLHAQIHGFDANEIQIGVSTRRLIVWGEKLTAGSGASVHMLDQIDLPAPIDTEKAEANVTNGVLEFKAPKRASSGK